MHRSRVATLGALAVALLAVGLALTSCGGGDETTPTTAQATTGETELENTGAETGTTTGTTTTTEEAKPVVVRITVLGGAPRGGIVREAAKKGDRVVLVVKSDEADEVHVHGYDLSRAVAPGEPARISFLADVPGRFEVELEESGVQIADLTVRP